MKVDVNVMLVVLMTNDELFKGRQMQTGIKNYISQINRWNQHGIAPYKLYYFVYKESDSTDNTWECGFFI